MTARDAKGELVGEGDPAAQTRQVLENMKAVLEAAGASMSDVVKITVFIKNLADSNAVREVRQSYFSKPYPASTLVVISSLADPRFLVEIEAIAVAG
jgi:enamine deaminase RidA (YjgF/YER057c/UK114 family)